jgi:hypothetical protein
VPVKYDSQYVKRPKEEIEYSPEEISELYECSKDVNYFIKYVKIINPDRGEITFEPYDYQLELLRKFQDHRFNIALCSRQSGKTTIVSAYVLWYAMFNENKTIGIVSNKESSAKMILHRIKKTYECLPPWLKPGVTEYSKTFISFDNGTRLVISATSADAFRGETMNLLVCDEFAFVPGSQAEEFWAANYPTISASKEAKIVIISTPNGLFNIFHRIYSESELSKNTFIHTKVSWEKVPGRDQTWADEQIKNLGQRQFDQEFAVQFIGSTNTLISPDVLKVILRKSEEPIMRDLQDRLLIWEKPQDDATYVMGVDVAKGTGENYSVIQVLKIESIKPVKMIQVAVFSDNMTDIYDFADIINRLSIFYKNAYIMVENNSEGAAVVRRLWWEHENENLVNSGSKEANLGIRASRATKPKAVVLMKKLIEDNCLIIKHNKTLKELGSFIEDNGKFYGKDTGDDLVSGLYWACYILEKDIFDENFEFISKEDTDEDAWGILSDINNMVEDWSWLTNRDI